jgi:hypothetical protein
MGYPSLIVVIDPHCQTLFEISLISLPVFFVKGYKHVCGNPSEGGKKLENSEKQLSSERMVELKKISSGTFRDSAAMA